MFDNKIELNTGTIAVPALSEFTRINQDGYSSEYRLKSGLDSYVFRIRHQTEKNKVKSSIMERHNVTITYNEAPTDTYPLGRTFEAYTVIRAPQTADDAFVLGLVTAACSFTLDNSARIMLGEN